MRAGLEVDIECRAAGFVAGLLEGENFRVFDALVSVGGGADHVSDRVHDNGANVGIGRGQTDSGASEIKRAMEEEFIALGGVWHWITLLERL
jgi:hypothetical protein